MKYELLKILILCTLILVVFLPAPLFSEGIQEYDENGEVYLPADENNAAGARQAGELDSLRQKIDELTERIETLKSEKADDPYRKIGSVPGYNPRAKYYEVPEGFPKIEPRVRYLGNLRGTWHEMGVQYGERAGDLIRNVYEYSIDYFSKKMTVPMLREDLNGYETQIRFYAPEMIDFMEGIAEGASVFLADSRHADRMTDFDKILLINAYVDLDMFPPRREQREHREQPIPYGQNCTGIALSGKARGDLLSPTKNGETIIANHNDLTTFVPLGWNCVYVATPSDPRAHVFWSIQGAGMVGGSNLIVNDAGVSIGLFFGGESEDDDFAYGVLARPLQVHAAAHANSAKEAADIMVFGTQEYRDKTGRAKVLQTGLRAYLLADRNEVMVLETTPRRHAIRHPGDMGEVGNYVIYANWFGSKHYYDENSVRVNEPIGIPDPSFQDRYWTYDWFVKYNFGELDGELVREAQRSRYYFDKVTGRKIEFLDGSTVPLYMGMHTISSYWGAALGLDIGGTIHASQAILQPSGRIKINWVQGRPSEWLGPWQSTDFYGYRKKERSSE